MSDVKHYSQASSYCNVFTFSRELVQFTPVDGVVKSRFISDLDLYLQHDRKTRYDNTDAYLLMHSAFSILSP